MILHQEHEKEKERELILSVIDDGEEVPPRDCVLYCREPYSDKLCDSLAFQSGPPFWC